MIKTPRRRAREFAVQGLYQSFLNPDYSIACILQNIRESEAFERALQGKKPLVDEALFTELVRGTLSDKERYIDWIRPLLDRAESDVNPIEYSILLVACYELAQMPQTPYPVIINEAIETAKVFGGADGYKFINGILDKLAEQLRPHDPARKGHAS